MIIFYMLYCAALKIIIIFQILFFAISLFYYNIFYIINEALCSTGNAEMFEKITGIKEAQNEGIY